MSQGDDKAPDLGELAAELAELEQALEDAESAIAAAESSQVSTPEPPPESDAMDFAPAPEGVEVEDSSPPETASPELPPPSTRYSASGLELDRPGAAVDVPVPPLPATDGASAAGGVAAEAPPLPEEPPAPAEPETLRAPPILASYGSFVAALEDVVDALRRGAPPPLIGLNRAAQALVSVSDRALPLAHLVAAVGPYRASVEGRIAQVAALVALMAARLGHGESDRRDVAAAAALALSGRALREDLADEDLASCGDAGVFLEGARRMLPASAQGRGAALRMIVAADLSSGETRRSGHPLSLFVVAADAFERCTRDKELGGDGMRPDQALDAIRTDDSLERSSRVGLLAALGPYPVGTRVRLSSEDTAVVVRPASSADRLSDPTVAIVADALGNPAGGRCLDLSTSDVTITRAIDQSEADLGVGHFMFA